MLRRKTHFLLEPFKQAIDCSAAAKWCNHWKLHYWLLFTRKYHVAPSSASADNNSSVLTKNHITGKFQYFILCKSKLFRRRNFHSAPLYKFPFLIDNNTLRDRFEWEGNSSSFLGYVFAYRQRRIVTNEHHAEEHLNNGQRRNCWTGSNYSRSSSSRPRLFRWINLLLVGFYSQ